MRSKRACAKKRTRNCSSADRCAHAHAPASAAVAYSWQPHGLMVCACVRFACTRQSCGRMKQMCAKTLSPAESLGMQIGVQHQRRRLHRAARAEARARRRIGAYLTQAPIRATRAVPVRSVTVGDSGLHTCPTGQVRSGLFNTRPKSRLGPDLCSCRATRGCRVRREEPRSKTPLAGLRQRARPGRCGRGVHGGHSPAPVNRPRPALSKKSRPPFF